MQGRGYGSAALDRVLDYIGTKPFGTSDRVALTPATKKTRSRENYMRTRDFRQPESKMKMRLNLF